MTNHDEQQYETQSMSLAEYLALQKNAKDYGVSVEEYLALHQDPKVNLNNED